MTITEPTPPRWAEATLQSLVRPSDRESISGDLLEEYRAVRRPALGAFGANAWYVKHVLSVLWRLIQPCALTLAVLTLLSLVPVLQSLWFGSLVPAPGLSLLDALIYLWAGYRGVRRTGLIRTAVVTSASTGFVGFTTLFTAAVIRTPSLLLAPFRGPFIFVILATYLAMALGYSILIGTIGGIVCRRLPPARAEHARAS